MVNTSGCIEYKLLQILKFPSLNLTLGSSKHVAVDIVHIYMAECHPKFTALNKR